MKIMIIGLILLYSMSVNATELIVALEHDKVPAGVPILGVAQLIFDTDTETDSSWQVGLGDIEIIVISAGKKFTINKTNMLLSIHTGPQETRNFKPGDTINIPIALYSIAGEFITEDPGEAQVVVRVELDHDTVIENSSKITILPPADGYEAFRDELNRTLGSDSFRAFSTWRVYESTFMVNQNLYEDYLAYRDIILSYYHAGECISYVLQGGDCGSRGEPSVVVPTTKYVGSKADQARNAFIQHLSGNKLNEREYWCIAGIVF